MTFFQMLAQNPTAMILMLLIGLFMIFWLVVQVAIVVSPRARDYLSSFLPQWFGRKGRPFTKHEKIGACFQGVALMIIIYLIVTW